MAPAGNDLHEYKFTSLKLKNNKQIKQEVINMLNGLTKDCFHQCDRYTDSI